MNIQIAASAVLMGATTLVHVFVGGPEIMDPVLQSDLPPVVRAIVGVVWHAVTVLLAVMAVASAWLAKHPNRALFGTLAVLQGGFIFLFILYGLRHLGNVTEMAQWVFFAATLALLLWGEARHRAVTPADAVQ